MITAVDISNHLNQLLPSTLLKKHTLLVVDGVSGAASSSSPTALRTASTSLNHSSLTRFTSLSEVGVDEQWMCAQQGADLCSKSASRRG